MHESSGPRDAEPFQFHAGVTDRWNAVAVAVLIAVIAVAAFVRLAFQAAKS